jgi:hypothetical protein
MCQDGRLWPQAVAGHDGLPLAPPPSTGREHDEPPPTKLAARRTKNKSISERTVASRQHSAVAVASTDQLGGELPATLLLNRKFLSSFDLSVSN